MSAAAHSASGGPSGGNVASPVSPASEPVDIYLKAKAILSASQGAVDALSSFMAARAQLEDTYSKALTKLAKSSLNVDEASLHPAVFEAIASLRGDVANEARQHAEMHFSINKDVLEPLGSLKETADMVVRVSSEAKRSTKDVKVCYERCKKAYNKYLGLYKRACDACAVAGLPQPPLWVPDPDKPYAPSVPSTRKDSVSDSAPSSRPVSHPGTPSRGGHSVPPPSSSSSLQPTARSHSDGPNQRFSSSSSASSGASSHSDGPSGSGSAGTTVSSRPVPPAAIHTRDLTLENAQLTPEPSTKVQLSTASSSSNASSGPDSRASSTGSVEKKPLRDSAGEEALSVPAPSSGGLGDGAGGSYRTASGKVKRIPGLPTAFVSPARPHARSLGEEGRRLSEESRKENAHPRGRRRHSQSNEGIGISGSLDGSDDGLALSDDAEEENAAEVVANDDDLDRHSNAHGRAATYPAGSTVAASATQRRTQSSGDGEQPIQELDNGGQGKTPAQEPAEIDFAASERNRRSSAPAGVVSRLRDELFRAESNSDLGAAIGGGKGDTPLKPAAAEAAGDVGVVSSPSSGLGDAHALLSPVVTIAASKSPAASYHRLPQPSSQGGSKDDAGPPERQISSSFHSGLIGGKEGRGHPRRRSAGSIGSIDAEDGGRNHHHHHGYSDSETETLDDDSSSLNNSLVQPHSQHGNHHHQHNHSRVPTATGSHSRQVSSKHLRQHSGGSTGAAAAGLPPTGPSRSRGSEDEGHPEVTKPTTSASAALAGWGFNFGTKKQTVEDPDSVGRSISFGAFASGNVAPANGPWIGRQLSMASSGASSAANGPLGSGKDDEDGGDFFSQHHSQHQQSQLSVNDDSFSVASSEYSSGGGTSAWGMKLKSVTSYFMGGFGNANKDPSAIGHSTSFSLGSSSSSMAAYGGAGNANMTTEERLQSMRSHAHGCMQDAETARQECVEAWTAHARARNKFHDQATAAMAIFVEIDRRRSLEMCDSMRRYTVCASSMLANLQYDVQRLASTIESAGDAAEKGAANADAAANTSIARQNSRASSSGASGNVENDPFAGVSPILQLHVDVGPYLDYTTPSLSVSIAPEAGGHLKPASGGGLWWTPAASTAGVGGPSGPGSSPIHRSMSGRSIASTGSSGADGKAFGLGGKGLPSDQPAVQRSLSGMSSGSSGGVGGVFDGIGIGIGRAASMSMPPGAVAAMASTTVGVPAGSSSGSGSSRRASIGSVDSSTGASGGPSLLKKATMQASMAASASAAILPPPSVFDPNTGGHMRDPSSVSATAASNAAAPSTRAGIPPLAPPASGSGRKGAAAERDETGAFSPGGAGVASLSLSAFTAGFVPSPPPSASAASGQQQLHDRAVSSFQLVGSSSDGQEQQHLEEQGKTGGGIASSGVSRFFRFGAGASSSASPGASPVTNATRPQISSPLAPRVSIAAGAAGAAPKGTPGNVATGSGESDDSEHATGLPSSNSLDLSSLSSAGAATTAAGSKGMGSGKASFWSRFMSPSSAGNSPAQGQQGGSPAGIASPSEGAASKAAGSKRLSMMSITGSSLGKRSSPPQPARGSSSSADMSGAAAATVAAGPSIAAAFAADPGPIELCIAALFDPSQERISFTSLLSSTATGVDDGASGSSTSSTASLSFALGDSLRSLLAHAAGIEEDIPHVDEFDDDEEEATEDELEEQDQSGVYHPRPSAVAGVSKGWKSSRGAGSTASASPGAASSAGRAYHPPDRQHLRDFSEFASAQQKELNPVAAVLLPHCCGLLSSSSEGLPRLVAALEARRGEGAVLTRTSCLALVRVFVRALDVAAVISDYSSARALMIMSQTFYTFLQPTEEVDELLLHPLIAASNTLRHHHVKGPSGGSSGGGSSTTATSAEGAMATPAKAPSNHAADDDHIYSTPPSVAGGGAAGKGPSSSAAGAVASAATTVSTRRRVYVQAFVRGHHIWAQHQYWENAIFETLGTEMTKIYHSHHSATSAGPHIHEGGGTGSLSVSSPIAGSSSGSGGASSPAVGAKTAREREKEREAEAAMIDGEREHEITAGQLSFFSYNMMAFNVSDSEITAILDKYARFIRLDASETARLMSSVAAFRVEHTRQVNTEDKEKAARLAAKGATSATAAPLATSTVVASAISGPQKSGSPAPATLPVGRVGV